MNLSTVTSRIDYCNAPYIGLLAKSLETSIGPECDGLAIIMS